MEYSAKRTCLVYGVGIITSLYVFMFFLHCRKFAPRCSVCLQPIMPESGQEETVRIVALDRSFHVGCYKCEVSLPPPSQLSIHSLMEFNCKLWVTTIDKFSGHVIFEQNSIGEIERSLKARVFGAQLPNFKFDMASFFNSLRQTTYMSL